MKRWIPVAAFGLLTKAVLVAASFLWVAVYSHLVAPGHDPAHYQSHAAAVSPWIGILGGIPLVYLFCRRLARRPTCAALDLLLFAAAGGFDPGACTLGLATTLAAAYLGARAGKSLGDALPA